MDFLRDLITRHRGIFITLFVIPTSFIIRKYRQARWWVRHHLIHGGIVAHDKKAARIAAVVQEGFASGKRMCTARSPWKTMSIRKATYKNEMLQVKIPLDRIIHLDKENLTVRVEPLVTMAEITRYLVPRGFALKVQVEMDDLTVGGLCMGIGIETSSHRYGFLYETVRSFELVTPEGQLVSASETEYPDLFRALPMSHGTLGFLTAIELELVPISRFVRLEYFPCQTSDEFSATMRTLADSAEAPEFLEGLVYSASEGVVMAGNFAEKPLADGRVYPVNRWYKPWFHEHAETTLQSGRQVEYIPVRQYFHRHTPSIFFQLRDIVPFAGKRWFRFIFGWLGPPSVSLMKFSMNRSLRRRAFENRVAQDIVVPMKYLHETLAHASEKYGIFPMWVCPVRMFSHGNETSLLRNPQNGRKDELYFDLGIYGIPPAVANGEWNSVATGRELEGYSCSRGGFHMLYADIFMTRREFEEMFDHGHYRNIRTKFSAGSVFPEVYEKVIPERWLINLDAYEEPVSQPVEYQEKITLK